MAKKIRIYKEVFVIFLLLFALTITIEAKETQSIELSILEPLGVDRIAYPVTMGVPFPQGVLNTLNNLSVQVDNNALPLQTRSMLTWPDGSLKWVLLDFQRDLVGDKDNRCTLFFGEGVKSGPSPKEAIKVKQTESSLEVSTGPLTFAVAKDGSLPFQSASLEGRAILPKGTIESGMKIDGVSYKFQVTEKPVLEEPGPLRVVVKADGKAIAEDGKVAFDVTVRIYAYAGHPTLRIYFTLTNKIPKRLVHLEGCYLSLKPALRKQTTGFIVSSVDVEWNGISYVDQLVDGSRTLRIGVEDAGFDPWLPETHGMEDYETKEQVKRATMYYTIIPGDNGKAETRRDGKKGKQWHTIVPATAVLGDDGASVTFACRQFWHNAPKEISIAEGKIRLDLYPEWAEPLEWYRGVAKTHEILVDLRSGKADQQERMHFACANQKRPAPQVATRNWMVDSGAFGPVLRYQPGKYPWWEFVFRSKLKDHTFNTEVKQELGATMLDYGDYWSRRRGGQWKNNEMDSGYGLLLQMVRTGYPKLMDVIEPIIHHQIDVDTIHDAESTDWIGGQRYHFAKHGAVPERPPQLCHEWLEGPLFYYLLTGYKRAEEVALARAEHFCKAIDADWHRIKGWPRISGYPLMSLARMYECYRDEKYDQACEKILDWLEQWYAEDGGLLSRAFSPPGGRSKISGALADGIITCALSRHHQVTGNLRSWNLLRKITDDGIEKGRLFTPEGFLLKTSNEYRDYYAPEPDFYFEALAYLSLKTGDKRYAKMGYLNLQRLFVQRKMMTEADVDLHFYRYWLPALALFDELGILTDPKPW